MNTKIYVCLFKFNSQNIKKASLKSIIVTYFQIMNPDRRIVSRGHGPSDDSGSDDEENLRVSKCQFI